MCHEIYRGKLAHLDFRIIYWKFPKGGDIWMEMWWMDKHLSVGAKPATHRKQKQRQEHIQGMKNLYLMSKA